MILAPLRYVESIIARWFFVQLAGFQLERLQVLVQIMLLRHRLAKYDPRPIRQASGEKGIY